MKTLALIALFLSPSAFAGNRVSASTSLRGWDAHVLCVTDENTKKKYELGEIRPRLLEKAQELCGVSKAELVDSSIFFFGSCTRMGDQPKFSIYGSVEYVCAQIGD